MREIRKRARAETDLIEIWVYTYERWGEEQAEGYLAQLEEGINQLRRFPEQGRRRDDVRKGYRSLRIHRHTVYYTVTASSIQIIRVLHEKMDPGRQLPS